MSRREQAQAVKGEIDTLAYADAGVTDEEQRVTGNMVAAQEFLLDEAILFGPGTRGEPTAQDWADLLDTIHYEVVTSPRGRITRTYREAENR